jgi:DNA-binding transcriptional MerR regulator
VTCVVSPRPREKTRSSTSVSEIPDKLYFKIGEVAELVGVETHVLRYWEKEIPFIRPSKTVSNQRRYRRKDVEVFREIRRLLHDERYTLAGARRRLLGGERGREEVMTPAETPIATAPAAAVAHARPAPGRATLPARTEPPPAPDRQLALGFAKPADTEHLERVRAGLTDLIRLAGEEP